MNNLKKKKNILEIILKGTIYLSAFLTLGIILWILIHVIINGIASLGLIRNLSDNEKLFPMIMNTFYIVLLSIGIAAPIGISAAIYLNEYSKNGKLVNVIRFAIQSLAGIPSIIFGLFGMIVFVIGLNFKWSILSGALTLCIMVLPTIIRTTEEALKTVPMNLREGSLALGATKIQTIKHVVIPSAFSGILIAIILSIGRIVGETAAVYLTAGMVPRLASSFMDSGRTLSVHLYILAKEGISLEKAYLTGTILILFILIINFTANRIVHFFNRKVNM